VPPGMKERVDTLGMKGVLVGPNQVRLDRVTYARNWMPALVKVLRTMADAAVPREAVAAAG